MGQYWIYILLCKNNGYYTGYTNNLIKRYRAHINGTGRCKYTRSFKPLCVAQCWPIQGPKRLAMEIERRIKSLSRADKEKLILNPILLNNLYSQD